MAQRKEMECTVPSTTKLKLFKYPHKHGGTSWCVGFERHNFSERGEFVSQTFLTEWTETYSDQLDQYKRWQYILGVEA